MPCVPPVLHPSLLSCLIHRHTSCPALLVSSPTFLLPYLRPVLPPFCPAVIITCLLHLALPPTCHTSLLSCAHPDLPPSCLPFLLTIEEGWRPKQRQRSSRLFGGKFIQCLAALTVWPRSIWKKRMNSTLSWGLKACMSRITSSPAGQTPVWGGRLNSTQVFSPHEKFKNLNSECKFILWFSWTATIHGLIYNAVVAVRILTLCGLPQYADK